MASQPVTHVGVIANDVQPDSIDIMEAMLDQLGPNVTVDKQGARGDANRLFTITLRGGGACGIGSGRTLRDAILNMRTFDAGVF